MMQNMTSWLNLISDPAVLKILLYLEKYNPDVYVRDLEKDLRMHKGHIEKILSELKQRHIITFRERSSIELTERGRVAVERLMTLV